MRRSNSRLSSNNMVKFNREGIHSSRSLLSIIKNKKNEGILRENDLVSKEAVSKICLNPDSESRGFTRKIIPNKIIKSSRDLSLGKRRGYDPSLI